MRIKHLEDLKPKDLLSFVKTWNKDCKQYVVNEKVDGNSFSFGLDKELKFYIKSNHKTYYSIYEIPLLWYMEVYNKYFIAFSKIKNHLNEQIEFQGEMIPTYNHNVICYDRSVVQDGIFVLFSVDKNSKIISDQENINKYVDFLNQQVLDIKTYSNITNALDNIKFDESSFEENVLNKEQCRELAWSIKQSILNNKEIKSLFGDEYEGFVISRPNDKFYVKIVDKENFTRKKEERWKYSNELKQSWKDWDLTTYEYTRYSEYKFKLSKLRNLHNQLYEQKTISREQWEDLSYCVRHKFNQVVVLEREAEENPDSLLPHKALLLLEDPIMKILDINVKDIFGYVNSVIPADYAGPTMFCARRYLGFIGPMANGNTHLPSYYLGNAAGEYRNDIDLSMNKEHLKIFFSVTNDEDMWKKLGEYLMAKKLPFKMIKNLKQFHIVVPLRDVSLNHANAVIYNKEKQTFEVDPNNLGYVQIDFFVGKTDWMIELLSGCVCNKSKYKAAHRNILLRSIFSNLVWPSKKEQDVYYKMILDFKEGLRLTKRKTIKQLNNRKDKEVRVFDKVVTTESKKMLKYIFTSSLFFTEVDSFECLYKQMKENFRYPQLTEKIMKFYIKELREAKLVIPEEIKEYESID